MDKSGVLHAPSSLSLTVLLPPCHPAVPCAAVLGCSPQFPMDGCRWGGMGGTATSPFSVIHWQCWCIPAFSSTWPRSRACSQSACNQTRGVPGWDCSGGEKESLAKVKCNILQCVWHRQQIQPGPSAQHSVASSGLLVSVADQMVKSRPCLSTNQENMLEGHGGAVLWVITAGMEHGHATVIHGQIHQTRSRRKHNTASPDTPNSCLSQLGLTSPTIPSVSTMLSGTGVAQHRAQCSHTHHS